MDRANGAGNRRHIGIEICRNKDNGFAGSPSQRLEGAYRNAAEYVAHVLIQYGWGTNVLKQHWHHSGKNCPRKIRLFKRWNWFKNLVQQNMDRINGVEKEAKPEPTPQPKPQPALKPIEKSKAPQLEVALKDLKFKANKWRTEEVEAKGTFVVGGSSIMTRFGSPSLNSAEGGRAQSGYKVNFDLIALTEEYAWLRYSFNNRVKWIPFATRAGFEKGEYWGEFE